MLVMMIIHDLEKKLPQIQKELADRRVQRG
jgi:hypothetical protein